MSAAKKAGIQLASPKIEMSILDYIDEYFFVVDKRFIVTQANTKFLKLCPGQAVIGRSLWDTIGEFRDTSFSHRLKRVHETGKKANFAIRHPNKKIWYGVKSFLIGREVAVFLSDITKRKLMEDKWKDNEKKFKLVAENAKDLISIVTVEGNYVYVSPSYEKILGYKPKQLIGIKSIYDLVEPEDLARIKNWRNVTQAQYRLKRADKEWIWVEGTRYAIKWQGKTYIAGFARDITEQKIAREELHKLYSAVEQTLDGVFITTTSGKIVYVNPAFERFTGYTESEVIGKTPSIIKSGMHNDHFYNKLWNTILKGETFRSVVVNRKKNGDLFYVDHTITPVKDDEGNITYFVGIWKDITEHIQQEKRKDEFISMASHELKTPITTIKVFTQLLQKMFKGRKKQEVSKYLDRMGNQVDRLTNLVGDLLDVSKIQAGKLELRKEIFDMNELVEETVENVGATIDTHAIKVKGKASRQVFGDRDRIGQVLINMLSNAIKYSPEAHRVEVVLEDTKKGVTVYVKDFGVGIEKEHQDKIFERFYRVYDSQDKTYPGLGMGLYISYEIVKRHNGNMGVKSIKDKGSTFYFSLPNS